MKPIILILICLLSSLGGHAQKDPQARKILDATASVLQKQGGFQIKFTATTFQKGQEQGRLSGTMQIKGKKFRLSTPDMTTWFDGKTQWSYLKANEEVNVSNPTDEELQTLNPYAFIALYKKGYDYTMKPTTTYGKAAYEIKLKAENKAQQLQTLLLDVEQATQMPLCVRIYDGQHWVRIAIDSFTARQKFNDEVFRFNAKDYPKAEIIDMR